jgi:quinoprotein glucose dehydrogenase
MRNTQKMLQVLTAIGIASFALSAQAQYGAPNGEWHFWGGDAGSTRYSALDQINKDNINDVQVVWRWKALPLDGGRIDSNLKATPLYVDGVLYTPTGVHQAAALDPKTGATLWTFSPEPPDIDGRNPSSSSRALTYWTDGKEKRVYHNTLDGRLISIDAKTGNADPKFGQNGYVILKDNLVDREVPFVGSSSPAIVVGDVIIAQIVTYITSPNREAPPGFIRGYDVRTGKLLWTFHTIPQKGEFGNDTWENNSWAYTGNTGVWTMMSADLEKGYVYLPVEAPSHDFYGGQRLGDNLYGQSLVCLDAKTGERIWHFQMVHHPLWDYDPPAAPILGDIKVNGKIVPAVTQLTKQGMSFVFNRYTGEPVWPIEEKPVPQSDVPGERTSPTQPFPTKPPSYVPLGYDEKQLINFTPELHAEAKKIAERYVRGPIYTPPSRVGDGAETLGTWVQPGYGGGANWNGGAFDPETGMMFVPTRNSVMNARLEPADAELTNWDYIRATTASIQGPRGLPINAPPWSLITATDMNNGAHTWSRSIGPAPDYIRNHPDLKDLPLDFDNMGYIGVRPSPLATKSLMFMGQAGNLRDRPGDEKFNAYDKTSGEILRQIELPSKPSGAPMTYMHQGKQYIVVAVATEEHPAEIVALSLRDNSTPKTPLMNNFVATQQNQRIILTVGEQRLGKAVFDQYCVACHGANGEGLNDLGPSLQNLFRVEQITQAVSLGGVEMPPMQTMLSEEQIDQVSRFVAAGFKQ